MTRPWYHPAVIALGIAMMGVALYFFMTGIFTFGWMMMADEAPAGSIDRTIDLQVLHQDFVSDWPSFLAGLIWMSVCSGATMLSLLHVRMAIETMRTQYASWQAGLVDVEALTQKDLDALDQWVEQGRVPLERLRGTWL